MPFLNYNANAIFMQMVIIINNIVLQMQMVKIINNLVLHNAQHFE